MSRPFRPNYLRSVGEWLFWGLVVCVVVGLSLGLSECQAQSCRDGGGRWASGWYGGRYVGVCIEPERKP